MARAADLTPGSGALVASELVLRSEPSFDAAGIGTYGEGSWVTVGDAVYGADGSLWYAVDGGYLPAYGLSGDTSGTLVYAQDATTDETWVDPNATDVATDETWVDPNATETTTDETWVDPNATEVASDQTWVDPSATEVATDETWVDPNATDVAAEDTWVDPNATDVATEDTWTEPVATEAPAEDTWTDSTDTQSPGAVIATAWIAGTDGEGAHCRTAPDFGASELGVIPEGTPVDVTGETVGEWQPVNCNGSAGYVHASLIAWEAPAVDDGSGAVTDDASGDNGVSTAPPPADDSTITAASDSHNCNGRRNKCDDNGNGSNGNGASAGNDGNNGGETSGRGQDVVNFAMQYVGYPYVYAGEGPNAFDCSGFSMYVIQQVLGINITHDMFTQVQMGSEVSRDALQPGDVVFFQNTFRPGLSHVAIYIGNGQIVHAENETTGVVVSDLNSDYYSSRYYDARRYW